MKYTFKYFRDPETYSLILPEKAKCDICGKTTKCFDGSVFYGEEERTGFCFECVAKGRLKEVGASGVDPDIGELTYQIRDLYSDLSEENIADKVRKITADLESSAPKIPTWQDWFWPAHCGDYAEFVCLAGQHELKDLTSDVDGLTFFKNSSYDLLKLSRLDKNQKQTFIQRLFPKPSPIQKQIQFLEKIWPRLKQTHIKGVTRQDDNWSPKAYLFQCKKCQKYLTVVDFA